VPRGYRLGPRRAARATSHQGRFSWTGLGSRARVPLSMRAVYRLLVGPKHVSFRRSVFIDSGTLHFSLDYFFLRGLVISRSGSRSVVRVREGANERGHGRDVHAVAIERRQRRSPSGFVPGASVDERGNSRAWRLVEEPECVAPS